MKKVIDLKKYKADKENEILVCLKQRIEDKGKAEKIRFFKYWSKFIIFSGIAQALFSLAISIIVNRNIVLKSMINFILSNILLWIILEIIQKRTGSIICTNHFKRQKESILLDKEFDMRSIISMFNIILWENYDRNVDEASVRNCRRDYDSLSYFIKSDDYKKIKSRLRKVNNADYLKLTKIEKDLNKINNEIISLSNVTKEDLKKLS